MLNKNIRNIVIGLCLAAAGAFAQPAPGARGPSPFKFPEPDTKFHPEALVKPGDYTIYGSYRIIKTADGVFQLKDQGDPRGKFAGLIGTDIYLILGANKALLIDLGNNYMKGFEWDGIPSRKNAKEEFLTILDALAGKLPVEAAVTHAHPDHIGMTMALAERKGVVWMPKGEDMQAPKMMYDIDAAVYSVFDHATKTFDLGGGRVVTPLLVRGHTNGCSVYLFPTEMMLFTGDCLGIGAGRSLSDAASLKVWAADTQRLVDYMKAHFTPYQRYALKVYTGHSVENPIPGFLNINHGRLDIDYLDWRFVQDQALCGAAVLKGQWLNPESGLRYQEVINSQTRQRVSLFTYGIGAVEMPLAEAYKAAGLKMAE